MKSSPLRQPLAVAGILLAMAGAVQAQAVFLARKAIGRIEQMTQSAPPSNAAGASYDVATVIVDVTPDRVFDAVKRQVAQNRKLDITRIDEARRLIQFTDGAQIGGIQVTVLSEQISQLLVSTARSGAATTSSTIVGHVLDVCRRLEVRCEQPGS